MADTRHLLKRLGVADRRVEGKANEYVRMTNLRLSGGGLGQGELCKGAACVDLACMTLQVPLDAALLVRCSGVSAGTYQHTRALLQKVLGVSASASARDLCIRFGCARYEGAVRAALGAYKERFVAALPEAQRGHVDFGRPVFLAAAFYLVARKNKVQVDRSKLLPPLAVTAAEFGEVLGSMSDLVADLVGTADAERRKRKVAAAAGEEGEEEGAPRNALIEATGGPACGAGECGSEEEEVEDEGMVGHRVDPKKARRREYEEWKEGVLRERQQAKDVQAAGGEAREEKRLRQAVLSFARAPAPEKEQGEGQEGAAPSVKPAVAGKNAPAAAKKAPASAKKAPASAKKGGRTPRGKVAAAAENQL